ncbi:HlyD family secretion protein [Rhizobium sp. BE258]|uniref:HlyD family secretion protein n=1 Tax=Rhizobium sp. BE258 TaxID=2817722 RepID=UPI000DDACC2B|nr:HlyD family secretion protein [Rhizobium sp. BE258]MDR7145035.1 membrane fusion protein (multidrug efflux system) [Rhizobium sp. BE258]
MTDNVRVLNPAKPIAETTPNPTAEPPAKVAQEMAIGASLSAAEPPPRKRRGGRGFLIVGGLAVFVGAVYYGQHYWTVGRFQVETDDAYVKADSSAIAPKVSGYLKEVLVSDNEVIKAGAPLARIDDRDFRAALDQANADVLAAQATLEASRASLDIQQSNIAAAEATLEVDKANELFAEQNNKRYSNLATSGYAPVQTAQQAASQIAVAKATVARDEATLETARKQILLINAQIAQASATVARAQAQQRQAELNLSYTTIVAPVDGVVGNRTLRTGQYVQAGTQLMSLVPTQQVYVVANYKETQLTDVRPGQEVEIDVDMFPGKQYHGRIDSIAPASGQEFALLPPDNATGNFTKVVQRIPVKIILDRDDMKSGDLRPGMSVQPVIDIRSASDQ